MDEYRLINSPLSRKMTRDGMTIEVLIYRGEDDPDWHLEVVDQEGGSTVWEGTFSTDQQALDEVLQTVENEGIASFLRDPDEKLH
jgi:hypothetical protein